MFVFVCFVCFVIVIFVVCDTWNKREDYNDRLNTGLNKLEAS